ncbi:hypothetical protein E5161_16495 [Cohnella pontilimi]|uniref:Uncharacterized protein n=2 Tax=Cohnella pontilimi TaxID=2564100 RepID=A0A4U0F826_9BACL|nr:hypothetical protein E5161_16495 [Cohnella pontilimi]
MQKINALLHQLSHDYLLISIAAVLFFGVKTVAAYLTYRHYNRKLNRLEMMLRDLTSRSKE